MPTPHQQPAPNTVATAFTIAVADTAGVSVRDSVSSVIATSSTVIESAATTPLDTGVTSLIEVGNQYLMVPTGAASGPMLKYNGAAVTAGEFGAMGNPIGAEAIAGGYEVAWNVTGVSQYFVWNTDANGNYLNSPTGLVSGTDPVLENIETSFKQNLNGDGTVGIGATAVIESAATTPLDTGVTSLILVGNQYLMVPTGTAMGPALKYNGAAVTAGEFGTTANPIGAEATASGYEVAWKLSGVGGAADQYIVWNTDANGNYLSNPTGLVSGFSFMLEDLKPSFHQDLNGNGRLSAQSITTAGTGNTVNLSGQPQAATIDLGANTASAGAGLTAPSLAFIGTPDAIALGSGASIVEFAMQASSGIETVANFVLGTDLLNIDLLGASSGTLRAYDTTVGGVHAIAIASSGDAAHGIVLLNMTGGQTAANLLASHTTFAGGHALIG